MSTGSGKVMKNKEGLGTLIMWGDIQIKNGRPQNEAKERAQQSQNLFLPMRGWELGTRVQADTKIQVRSTHPPTHPTLLLQHCCGAGQLSSRPKQMQYGLHGNIDEVT